VAVPERRNDRVGDFSRAREHGRVPGRALERRERLLQMGCDQVLRFLAHDSWLTILFRLAGRRSSQTSTLAMITLTEPGTQNSVKLIALLDFFRLIPHVT
jgi:hypothetical protein